MPELAITLSCEVCPEIREYERGTTATVNAYVQPLMASYLGNLQTKLAARGFRCPTLLMTSGGGLTDLETARQFPIRLVESGPAGGAVLASVVARANGLDKAISFDMGGTTAKICLLAGGMPSTSREFEVDRTARFQKGSGLPIRIPVVEMVEIGAGGGSLASVDALGRVTAGPKSAGSEPGPACYSLGGTVRCRPRAPRSAAVHAAAAERCHGAGAAADGDGRERGARADPGRALRRGQDAPRRRRVAGRAGRGRRLRLGGAQRDGSGQHRGGEHGQRHARPRRREGPGWVVVFVASYF
jgi:hypothetical protein